MRGGSPALLLLGGASLQQGQRCIQQARARGLRVWLTDLPEHLDGAPELVAAADQVAPLPYEDPAACVAWANQQARSERFVGVFGFREYSVEAVARVSDALGLPGNDPEAVRRVRDKHSCREALRERGFRQPAGRLCSDLGQALEFARAHPPAPWIVKPPAAMGSQGVSLVEDAGGWGPAMVALGGAAGRPFLVESFQPGPEFSAEGLFVDGRPCVLALTAKTTTGAPHFVELGHTMPAELDRATARTVEDTVSAALEALGISWGPFHVEFWLDGGEPVLGEVHVRPGGDYIHWMVELVTGIELYGAVYDQLLGRPPDRSAWQPRQGAAIRYLVPPPGTVTEVRGWDVATGDPACQLAELELRPGDRVGAVRGSSDRPGFVLATAPTAREAARAAERLCAAVEVRTSDTPAPCVAPA